MSDYNIPLLVGAGLSAIAALLHICIIFSGPAWYRFFGAGERMAAGAAAGHLYPALVTLLIACMLGVWAAYALSGAGVLQPLPLLALALPAITAVYLLRGLVVVALFMFDRRRLTAFWVWSSAICLVYGVVHLVGVVQVWERL
ncbi:MULTISPECIES: hypothetical protein [Variovorax]|uniref:hypothetical protein n=1 Tax=Variovorax TaxID=34072 RepID=UPI00086D311C|nr:MULTISPECIES: hypothetical protein [Variovorax]ODU16667.1 MAG: hypothetical protein ABS94_11015 [Variovorax sp. SCN 67-85]ODV23148.1 MAG: hypothetical protein ABT25_19920 [Variovorax sp. SCN 67-20]OJZ15464.1 MAG: hypothetical protein BGP22_21925 [Variovorax sp. 67-131]UKI07807.1 hypothetical protein L3V85_34360 [Variovorax paradoxus]